MLLVLRGRQRNVSRYKSHVQSDWFCSYNLLFRRVVDAAVVDVDVIGKGADAHAVLYVFNAESDLKIRRKFP